MDDKQKQAEVKPRRPRKKRARGHAAHHGGSWKVAYADFVTAMMALFLVLWLVSQADTKLKEQIANYFRSPGVFTSSEGGILPDKTKVSREPSKLTAGEEEQALFGIAQQLQKKFDSQPEFSKSKDKVVLEVVEDGLQIEILDKADDVSFEVGSSQLNEHARRILEEIAAAICTLPNPIKIGGHTDRRVFPSNTGYTNWELSTDRANAARRILVNACVDPGQIFRVIGFADTDPIIERDPYHPANRRISITVMRMSGFSTDEKKAPVKRGTDPGETREKDDRMQLMRKGIERDRSDSKPSQKDALLPDVLFKTGSTGGPRKDIADSGTKKTGNISVGMPDKIPDAPRRKEKDIPRP